MSYSQKTLQQFIARRHPLYEAMKGHWDFLEETYEGGRAWFAANLHRYIKEGTKEYQDRLRRAYRFNHTREVVDLLDKYVFKMEIQRNEDAPDFIQRFWKRATLTDLPITEFMKRVSNRTSTFGRVWIVVDSTKSAEVQTVADEKATDSRVYAYVIKPQHALDMSFDQFNQLNWILFYETERDDADPINSSGDVKERYRLWTRQSSQLFRVEYSRGKPIIVVDEPVPHGLGVVPVFAADNMISDDVYTSPALIADVAYLDRAVANYLSNLDAVIQDQTFSQLIIPSQAIEAGTEGYDKLVEMGTKRIFSYDASGGGKPEFISPDVKQSELILQVISKIINEIYHSVGLAGERTKQDNSQGIDNSSGVAKAYDFERVNSLLAAKADALEAAERKLCELVALWNGQSVDVAPNAAQVDERQMVSYPKDFDVRGLYDEFDIAARLSLIEAPNSVRRQQMDSVIRKLFPMLKQNLIDAMRKDLQDWPPVDALAAPGASNSPMGQGELQKMGGRVISNQMVKSSMPN
ncbi:hypothetical protein [Burkholderia vietnamiensis]|uniref:hypothetical protein n=1 Tax=Burkholderia vietnamiensis TaxID=60552 RepID=UPI001CB026D2|nr:hypothetical protein [Burkholderia vietnamiensis]CAG9228817.1 conserved hypothetical protein [Burkholderia vietnamiensis]HDR9086367.1 hypothetical protein [Burkholderia vietnamiensis]